MLSVTRPALEFMFITASVFSISSISMRPSMGTMARKVASLNTLVVSTNSVMNPVWMKEEPFQPSL